MREVCFTAIVASRTATELQRRAVVQKSRFVAAATALILLAAGAAVAGPDTSKADPALTALYEEHRAHQATRSGAPFSSQNRLARVVDDRVVIDAVAEDDDTPALEAELRALGMQNIAVFGRVVSGELPLSAIPALDGIVSLRFARPSTAGRRVGSVTSQGDRATRADIARVAFGLTGAGVKVGVLSDSFDCLHGASGDVASGDLSSVTVIQEIGSCAGGTDEGRAMLQIVHDVAPGATLLFASAINGKASFANNIVALKNNGANVIVDDIGYFDEPMFQDGIIAQAVDTVVGQGAAFFSAAGNSGREAYESVFRPGSTFTSGAFPSALGAPRFLGGVAHNFATSGPASHWQRITVPAGATVTISFQWDSPFFSVSGAPGSANDLDVYLFNSDATRIVAGATANNTGRDAVEVLNFTNVGPTADFKLMLVKFSGPTPGFIKYAQVGDVDVRIAEFRTDSGTIFGHPNANGATAVGAASYASTPAFGSVPPVPEPFSSAGPTPILFDATGQRLAAPVIRSKPEIVAPDGVATTIFSPFFGTSASAPHAAAVAALLVQRRAGLSPMTLYSALENTAVDMGPPGVDGDTGSGLIQAAAAIQAITDSPVSLGITLNRHAVAVGDSIQASVSMDNRGTTINQNVYFLVLVPPALSATVGCPAGDAGLFLTNASMSFATRCLNTAAPHTYPPLFANIPIQTVTTPDFYHLEWPASLPAGVYTVMVITTGAMALADDNIGPGDITAIAIDSFRTPP